MTDEFEKALEDYAQKHWSDGQVSLTQNSFECGARWARDWLKQNSMPGIEKLKTLNELFEMNKNLREENERLKNQNKYFIHIETHNGLCEPLELEIKKLKARNAELVEALKQIETIHRGDLAIRNSDNEIRIVNKIANQALAKTEGEESV